MDAMYPATTEDDGLWDELSNAQSREIQQHHSRYAAAQRTDTKTAAILDVAKRTAASIGDFTSTAYGLATNLASLAANNGAYRHVPIEDNRNLSEFGLQSEYNRSDPLLVVPEDNSNSYGYNQHQTHLPMMQAKQQHQQPQQHPSLSRDANNEGNNDFVFLKQFRLLPKKDGWGAVANLDLFFSSLYNYYYHGGLIPIIGKGVAEIVTLFFTLILSVFLFTYVDWKELATCTDENSCKSGFSSYIIEKPFHMLSLWNFIVILYCILFISYGVFAVWGFLVTCRDALEAKHFFEDNLGISARKLEGGVVDWDKDVIVKIIEMQKSGENRIAIHGQEIDALVVAHRILRKENFMVAFFNRHMLDMSIPLPWLSNKPFFSKSLEWSLYFCVLNFMFNHKYQIRPAFCLDPPALKRRFMLCGIAHAVFMPFLLFFMTLHFLMSNVYDWKLTKQYLGPREWSLSAKWTMREFNELPHIFERRLGPSYEGAEMYIKLFTQSAIVTSLGRIMAFIGGSLGVVLLVFATVNDAILLYVKIGDWNLLWYAVIFGVLFSAGKAMLPDTEVHSRYTRNLFCEMDAALEKVAVHTHHYPDIWKGRGWDQETYTEFGTMFKYKAKLFAMEIVSVVLAPLILFISLPKCADQICKFVADVKTEVPGVGDVCGYATFNFDSFEDENWEGRTIVNAGAIWVQSDVNYNVPASFLPVQDTATGTRVPNHPKTRQGKMEKSFFSFKAAHTSWKPSQSGQELVDKVEKYRYEETLAVARERQLHIEAAARQLETLNKLEQRKQVDSYTAASRLEPVMDESYIEQPKPIARTDVGGEADSGGGGNAPVRNPEVRGEIAGTSSPLFQPLHNTDTPPLPISGAQFDSPLQTPASVPRRGEMTPPPFASLPLVGTSTTGGSLMASSPVLPNIRHYGMGLSLSPSTHPTAVAGSVLHYADIDLSTELRKMLNRSTLDAPDMSVLPGSFDPIGTLHGPLTSRLMGETTIRDITAERQQQQYLWLEKFHSFVADKQQRDQQQQQIVSRSMSEERQPAMHASHSGSDSRANANTASAQQNTNRDRSVAVATSSIL